MFIATITDKNPSSVRSVMSTFRPYGAGMLFDTLDYKHFVPNGTFLNRSLDSLDFHSGFIQLSTSLMPFFAMYSAISFASWSRCGSFSPRIKFQCVQGR